MKKLILASASPQRRDILKTLGLDFDIISSDFDETSVIIRDPVKKCKLIARGKARQVRKNLQKVNNKNQALIIAADTLIFEKNLIFGKPAKREEAKTMLLSYSASSHKVISAISCIDYISGKLYERQSISQVYFKSLDENEIDFYLNTEEWKNVAGAYRIQGCASLLIEKIEGSYSGIVGLPLHELYEILKENNINILKK